MRRHRTNIEGLAAALNEMGIKTSIVGSVEAKDSLIAQAMRKTENARQLAVREIGRIYRKAKRPTSR